MKSAHAGATREKLLEEQKTTVWEIKKYIKKYIPQKQTLSAQCVTQELNIDT